VEIAAFTSAWFVRHPDGALSAVPALAANPAAASSRESGQTDLLSRLRELAEAGATAASTRADGKRIPVTTLRQVVEDALTSGFEAEQVTGGVRISAVGTQHSCTLTVSGKKVVVEGPE